MNPDSFDRQLEAYARQPLPAAPTNLSAGVWREIDRQRAQPFLGWGELLKRPGWMLAGLAFALAVGAIPAVAFSRAQQVKRLARDSLHFDVFSPRAPGQLASVLTKPNNAPSSSP